MVPRCDRSHRDRASPGASAARSSRRPGGTCYSTLGAGRCQKVEAELALEALLDDLHVQQALKPARKPKPSACDYSGSQASAGSLSDNIEHCLQAHTGRRRGNRPCTPPGLAFLISAAAHHAAAHMMIIITLHLAHVLQAGDQVRPPRHRQLRQRRLRPGGVLPTSSTSTSLPVAIMNASLPYRGVVHHARTRAPPRRGADQ